MSVEDSDSTRFSNTSFNVPNRHLKISESKEIDEQVKKFLKSGGKITPIGYCVSGLKQDDTITTGHSVPTIVRREKKNGVLVVKKTSMHKKAMTIKVDRLR